MVKEKVDKMSFDESCYIRDNNRWKASTLYLFAKAKEYDILDLPLWGIDISCSPFNVSNLYDFIFQCKRVEDCSLEHPIILDDLGCIADGYHRVCKAILEGKETIKAIRLKEMPAPDSIEHNE